MSGWGVPDLTSGGVRIFVVSNTDRTLGTPLSPPVTFAQQSDTGIGLGQCARLVLADDMSRSAFGVGTVLYEERRRPAVLASFDVDGLTMPSTPAGYPTNIELPVGQRQAVRDFDSFLMPPLMPAGTAGENVLSATCTNNAGCAASAASCPVGAAGVACRMEHYVNTTLYTEGFPAIRLRAVDEDGSPVAGLRVRLRSLQQLLFPDLPRSTEIVSCGLLSSGELAFYQSPAAAAYGPAAIKMINALPEMDGIGDLEEVCPLRTHARSTPSFMDMFMCILISRPATIASADTRM